MDTESGRVGLGDHVVQGCTRSGPGLPLQVHLLTPHLVLHHELYWPIYFLKHIYGLSAPESLRMWFIFPQVPPGNFYSSLRSQIICHFLRKHFFDPPIYIRFPSIVFSSQVYFFTKTFNMLHNYILSMRSYRGGGGGLLGFAFSLLH